jgi:hypothetical protein
VDRAPAFAAALACPDAFLLSTPGGAARTDTAFSLALAARGAGQRPLVMIRCSEEAAAFALRVHERGHAVVLCTGSEATPGEALGLTERRMAERERAEECLRLEAEVNRTAQELDRLSQAHREFQNHTLHEQALRHELAELAQAAVCPSGGLGGFVKKLFGAKSPADVPKRIAALEEQLRNLTPPSPVDSSAMEHAAAAHRHADAAFAWAIAKPLELAPETVAKLEIVVATHDALETSPLLADRGPRFDRLIVVDGEGFDEAEFLIAAARAEAWVFLGNPEAEGYFSNLWMHLHKPGPWSVEAGRIVYRLAGGDHDRTEPLADRPEIELRFRDGELAALAFPASVPLNEAKEFVARELAESVDGTERLTGRTATL